MRPSPASGNETARVHHISDGCGGLPGLCPFSEQRFNEVDERTTSRTPPLRRTDIVQVQGRSNESEMRKRLRKITDLPLRLRVVFFRKQADIVANR